MRSEEDLLGGEEDQLLEGGSDPMLVSPGPPSHAGRAGSRTGSRTGTHPLPDVRSLGDALEPPPPTVVGLQARARLWRPPPLLSVASCNMYLPIPSPLLLIAITVQNAVGNRVTLVLEGGACLRVALPFAPTGPLAMAALQALHEVLPVDTWWALYACWLSTSGKAAVQRRQQHLYFMLGNQINALLSV